MFGHEKRGKKISSQVFSFFNFSTSFNFYCHSFSQVLFATFDPPDPPVKDATGHFSVVALNIAQKYFEILDSLRGPTDRDGKRVLHTMATGIKKLWKSSTNSKGESFHPKSIDDWEYHYVSVPKQLNT